jgi:hypothetical protein
LSYNALISLCRTRASGIFAGALKVIPQQDNAGFMMTLLCVVLKKIGAYPQHPAAVLSQPQDGGPPVTMLLMSAAAQPTPEFTERAPNSQFMAQAPHSMQRSLSVTAARLPRITNTPCGQTSTHLPQPAHLSGAYCRVVTFARYFIPRPTLSA